MMQYLFNLTAIWLFSLLIFDMFLSRESAHVFNRAYLLTAFLGGISLPLIKWGGSNKAHASIVAQQVKNIVAIRQNVVTAITPTHSAGILHWLLLFYIGGIVLMLFLLLMDVIKLINYYRIGKRTKTNKWIIVETNQDHTPFSFFNILFVNDRRQYRNEEWAMILAHEGRHKKLLHFIDILILQITKIVFWFHPVIYLYYHRLLLVHEYQADEIETGRYEEYGHFLIAQAMLSPAPLLTHSLNRSPIKKRIIMLTRKSSGIAKTKKLLSLPVLLICLLFFSKTTFSQNAKKDDMINVFGVDATTQNSHVTYSQALANPVLSCKSANCKVIGYTISFVPKGGEMEGMYNIIGQSINGAALEKMKQFKNAAINSTRVFIEDIRIKQDGKEIKLSKGIAFKMYDN